jgi:hypothetical protein
MPPIQLTPQFGGSPAPQQQGQQFDPRLLLGLGGFAQGFMQGGQQGGLGAALLGGAAGGLPGIAQGQLIQQEQAQQQVAAQAQARQQQIENQRARQKALADAAVQAESTRRSDRTFGLEQEKEQRLIGSAQSAQDIARQNVELGRGNLGLRRKELERGPQGGVQVETVRMPNGSVQSFRRTDPALDQALQQGGLRFSAQLQAPDIAGLGGATTSTQTRAQSTIDTAQDTLGTIQQFREILRPENIGLSGDIRELGIGALGQAESLRAWADDQTSSIIDQVISSGDTLNLDKFAVDPDLSEQGLLENILAYRLAKIQDPDGRISDADFRNARLSLGTGKKLSGIGDILARLDAFEKTVNRTQDIARKRLGIVPGGQQPAQVGAIVQRRESLGVSQEDLAFTAQQNGMTVEQVLDQLEAR